MPHARYKTTIDASFETVSELLVDKVERPRKYVGRIQHSSILERGDGFVIREMYEPAPVDLTIREKVYRRVVPGGEEFVYEHLDDTAYTGSFHNILTRDGDLVELEYVMDWVPRSGLVDKISEGEANGIVRRGVQHIKAMAEKEVVVPEWVRTFYAAVESMNSDSIGPLLADNCTFRVANAVEIVGREQVVEANRAVLGHFRALRHDYVDVCGNDDRAFVESWVDYTMHDGSTYLLPFVTVFQRDAGLISAVKLFGDMYPLRNGWPTP